MSQWYTVSNLPKGAWDSHMHVTDPKRFPVDKGATYRPHAATLEQALENASKLQLPNLVFVQPSTYGLDNACLLDGLKRVGKAHGRAVIVADPESTTLEQLHKWHKVGVRGTRLNFRSVGKQPKKQELEKTIRQHADFIRPLKTWALQIYVDLPVVADLEDIADELAEKGDVKLVIDHMGQPSYDAALEDLSEIPGWQALLRMVEKHENLYVKVSAPYRMSYDPQYKNLEQMTRKLLAARQGDAVVFASDWPHTRFESTEIQPWVQRCLEWCDGDERLVEKLFRDNARVLWDVTEA